ncbi:hypothetical protein GY21_11060 [Cryobacterium roopkundense]|uniref:DUF6993 domain-containing protein n=1 Tax=Cryobacterium roopkundense TaxID=1001240 RepID=A0A099J612_9MICO|nr:hypothetical protein [Cryobacterium roopkundense]KGJ73505.1 hypothetical protein GY21_11060 [Cryobacterium roopkundense]MBB5641534.1 hypothetical protein [Cryobacterium roopkundense]
MRMPASVRRHRLFAGIAVVLLAIPLAGCTAGAGEPSPTATDTASPSASATATPPPPPALQPELSASANLGYFDSIANAVAATNPADGRAYIDALVAGGFDKSAMQLTFDRTHVDLAADFVQFSVQFNGECLIGQYGPASGGYHSMVAPILGSGTCLLSVTRQIDW